jgi:hypothetical protein
VLSTAAPSESVVAVGACSVGQLPEQVKVSVPDVPPELEKFESLKMVPALQVPLVQPPVDGELVLLQQKLLLPSEQVPTRTVQAALSQKPAGSPVGVILFLKLVLLALDTGIAIPNCGNSNPGFWNRFAEIAAV